MLERMDIATAGRRASRHWKQETVTWDEILEWVKNPADRKEAGNYVLGKLRETTVDHPAPNPKTDCRGLHRNKIGIVSRSAITMDLDFLTPDDLDDVLLMLEPYRAVAHTTYSSKPESPRLRVIIAVDRDMTPDEYLQTSTVLMHRLGKERFDPGSPQPERFMFKPGTPDPETYEYWTMDGDPVVVDDLLPEYDPEVEQVTKKPHKNKRDPFSLDGPAGAFNRAYSIQEAIEEFELPYEALSEERWHLVGAKSQAGMGLVADGLVYSHHANDPAYGQTCSAFDLVRLHRFGDLDSEVPEKTPVNRRPSHKAMLEFAMQDKRVMDEIWSSDFGDSVNDAMSPAADDVPPDPDWKTRLRMSTKTMTPTDTVQNWDLIMDNDPVLRGIYRNEMTFGIEAEYLPWRDRGGPTVGTGDISALGFYLEREYKIQASRAKIESVVQTVAFRRYVNPVRDYLDGLEWDGTPRLEHALPGVKPTEYTKMVARKALVAAVARVYEPGIKWDHILVLYGNEGLGKSWWIEKMSKGWMATLGRINDKDTLLAMQRSWIMISDEGHALRRPNESEAMKEFLTRTTDLVRLPYERETLAHPRRCVIWGTTNDEIFLHRQEGNRRFLIVRCESAVDFDQITDEYVDQVWAEAVVRYREGETLFITGENAEAAEAQREIFTEEDPIQGLVQEFTERLVPEEWDEMSPDQRVLWLRDESAGFEKGVRKMTQVCSVQIWVEAMDGRMDNYARRDLKPITTALKELPGWRAVPGTRRIKGYGVQRVYERIHTEDDDAAADFI